MSDGGGGPAVAGPARPTAEERRLRETREGVPWRAWGPHLSERQWGTVREDYSENGDAWSYFSHDQEAGPLGNQKVRRRPVGVPAAATTMRV